MKKIIVYKRSCLFKYYLISLLTGDSYLVSEREFFKVVGFDRDLVPMRYDENDINKQNFFMDGVLVAYRVRKAES